MNEPLPRKGDRPNLFDQTNGFTHASGSYRAKAVQQGGPARAARLGYRLEKRVRLRKQGARATGRFEEIVRHVN
jgi:hypothetical protein